MEIKKFFIEKTLKETVEEFSKKFTPIQNDVIVNFESKQNFMKSVKNNPLIQEQIKIGIYKDIDKEYVGFAVVYEKDKHVVRQMMGLPYVITICYEIARDKFKKNNSKEVKEYFKYVFAHELSHIFENEIISKHPKMWEKALKRTNNREDLAKEELANDVASLIADHNIYTAVEEQLWEKVFQRIKNIKKEKGIEN